MYSNIFEYSAVVVFPLRSADSTALGAQKSSTGLKINDPTPWELSGRYGTVLDLLALGFDEIKLL
jgi:hypothetical protein